MKKENGITLIALIITIIILVILAAVSIRAAYNSGIIDYSINGTKRYEEEGKKEESILSNTESFMKSILDKIGDNGEGESTGGLRIVVEEEENDDINAKVLKISLDDAGLNPEELLPLIVEAEDYYNSIEELMADLEEWAAEALEYGEEDWDTWQEQAIGYAEWLGIIALEVTSVELKYGNNQTLPIDELWNEPNNFMVRINGDYVISARNIISGETGTLTYRVSGITEETFTAKKSTNEDYMESGIKTAVIPEGFAVMNGSTKDNGIVITDEIITKDGNNYSVGNEFVWVPVSKAYMTSSDNLTTLTTNGTYPMALETGTGTYKGILYDFLSWDGADPVSPLDDNQGSIVREPVYLTDNQFGDANSDINTIGINQDKLQEEYDAMVESIDDNGGFYVARYEMSYNNSSNKAESQRGKRVASSADEKTNTWYGVYYASRNMYNNNNSSVQSMMITGAQYDQIMLWVRNITNYDGVYNSPQKASGRLEDYKVKNIFDLAGNFEDWTSESSVSYSAGWVYNNGRVSRGVYYHDEYNDGNIFYRVKNKKPVYEYSSTTSRISLYIKSSKTDSLTALTNPNGN